MHKFTSNMIAIDNNVQKIVQRSYSHTTSKHNDLNNRRQIVG